MPRAVRAALVSIYQRVGGMTMEQAEQSLFHLEKEGRYRQETW